MNKSMVVAQCGTKGNLYTEKEFKEIMHRLPLITARKYIDMAVCDVKKLFKLRDERDPDYANEITKLLADDKDGEKKL